MTGRVRVRHRPRNPADRYTSRRRLIRRALTWAFAIFVLPALVGSVATARAQPTDEVLHSNPPITLLGLGDLTDSRGIRVSEYALTLKDGGLLHPRSTIIASYISLEWAGLMVIGSIPIWIMVIIISLVWLRPFSDAMIAVGQQFSDRFDNVEVLMFTATGGSVIVAYYLVRGKWSKAALKILIMIFIAIVGPFFLANPLAKTFAPDGLFAQGRDVGMVAAAGLAGEENTDPRTLYRRVGQRLVDSTLRDPTQYLDTLKVPNEACQDDWDRSMRNNNPDTFRNALRHCDPKAYAIIDRGPDLDQLVAGLIFLIFAPIPGVMMCYLGYRFVYTVAAGAYHGIMLAIGLAGGGLVNENMIIRYGSAAALDPVRIACNIIFLGGYAALYGDFMSQARGSGVTNVVTNIALAGIVHIIAFVLLRRLNQSLDRTDHWVADRLATTMQGSPAVGGTPQLGMADARAAGNAGHHLAWLTAAMNLAQGAVLLAHSPVGQQFFRRRNALNRLSHLENAASEASWTQQAMQGERNLIEANLGFAGDRAQTNNAAARSLHQPDLANPVARVGGALSPHTLGGPGGINTPAGVTAAIHSAYTLAGADSTKALSYLTAAGFDNEALNRAGHEARIFVESTGDQRLPERLRFAVNGTRGFELHRNDATLLEMGFSLKDYRDSLSEAPILTPAQEIVFNDYMKNPLAENMASLIDSTKMPKHHNRPGTAIVPRSGNTLYHINPTDANNVVAAIGVRHADDALKAYNELLNAGPVGFYSPVVDQRLDEVRRHVAKAMRSEMWAAGTAPSTSTPAW
ncbi:hypothetical protein JK358_35655 [Nocardia sp. 2]|uniref:Uncharacterized protein n=1 Tax=Nocardia acididurans TaxID=2802282 RepID=A0ABS1MGT0_9NOCA|nr:hypothetical protein [Nocardia acididurans]MBL1079751.1 hypothetical protein [Nocardia acididurans]